MDTTKHMVQCSRADVCENIKCEHHGKHMLSTIILRGKSICYDPTCGGKESICMPLKCDWEV